MVQVVEATPVEGVAEVGTGDEGDAPVGGENLEKASEEFAIAGREAAMHEPPEQRFAKGRHRRQERQQAEGEGSPEVQRAPQLFEPRLQLREPEVE
jgi:hypothetical protein